ncbi:MAG: IS200/IS605 family transposase [Bacteroidales bacterium]
MRPGTFTQIYIQIVFAVYKRQSLITKEIREEVFRYMGGILNSQNHKTIIVNGVSSHVHIFFGLNPNISISDTVHDLKRSSSLYINKEKLTRDRFTWQSGYGAFSYSRSHLERVVNYI